MRARLFIKASLLLMLMGVCCVCATPLNMFDNLSGLFDS